MPVFRQDDPTDVAAHERAARAAEGAAAAFPAWSRQTTEERRRCVRQLRHVVVQHQDALALAIAEETGKPLAEVLSQEVTATLEMIRYLEAKVPRQLRTRRFRYVRPGFWTKVGTVHREPLGVLAIIGPANFPFSLIVMQAAQALLCGNCIVLKPSERCPRTARWIRDLLGMTDLDAGVAQVVSGGPETARALVAHDAVAKVFFTGSYAAGRTVAAQCGQHFKPCVLELGGNGCALVDADADLRLAARGIVWGAFYAGGQSCVGTRRVFVHGDVAGPFVQAVARALAALGDRDLAHPAPSARQHQEEAERFAEAAAAQGAAVYAADRPGRPSSFVPRVLHLPHSWSGEVPEPVPASLLVVEDVASMNAAVSEANRSRYGLSASVWSRNGRRARGMAGQLRRGIVWINDVGAGQPQFPWGGSRRSGWGRVLSADALHEMTHTKVVSHDRRYSSRSKIWWFPYMPEKTPLFAAVNRFMYGPGTGGALGEVIVAGARYGVARLRAALANDGSTSS